MNSNAAGSNATAAKKMSKAFFMVSFPFFVRVLMLFIFLFSRFFRFLSGKPTGTRLPRDDSDCTIIRSELQGGSRCFFDVFFSLSLLLLSAFSGCVLECFSHFSYCILAERFGKYKPYFTKKAKKSHNSCKPIYSIGLRRAGRGFLDVSAYHERV